MKKTALLYSIKLVLLLSTWQVSAMPFWGDKQSMPIETTASQLKKGQFVWGVTDITTGPVVVIVSLSEQRVYVYRNGIQFAYSTVSTGRKGHETPTGVFTILQLDKDHHSSIYNNASMPYTERLTWGGIALHAGGLPGYPSSHGCIHLPSAFASHLFGISQLGMVVVIAEDASAPVEVVHPQMLLPIDVELVSEVINAKDKADKKIASIDTLKGEAKMNNIDIITTIDKDETFIWKPELSEQGSISILVSAASQEVFVYRSGIEIGRSKVGIKNPEIPFGTHTFIYATDNKPFHWTAIGLSNYLGSDISNVNHNDVSRITIPQAFLTLLNPLLDNGIAMVITDAVVHKDSTGIKLRLVTADKPDEDDR